MVPRPYWHLQENFRLCQKVSQAHLQETLRQSATMPRPSCDLQETPRRFQRSPRPSEHLQEIQTVSDGARTSGHL
ncbi:hypothetical protein DPMN_194341 [Dreissena polymorpha]|uniref:Uncharacterized protein n=1 Tax=Dreissena polymorpha TaxID=45954 RepID=A0A9D3Y5U2_DREPO|nr:hypothetical protein DPMN_194341 [Dreissena polymorpha]